MAWVLGLVPAARWIEAIELIQRELDIIAIDFPNALRFDLYLRTQWLPLAGIVYSGSCVITNNICEAWNRWATRHFGNHRCIFDFSGNSIYFKNDTII